MLQDGQAYYLLAFPYLCLMVKFHSFHRTIVTINIITTIIIFIPDPTYFRTAFTIPNVALMNIMACRVFRNTILFATDRETEITTIQI